MLPTYGAGGHLASYAVKGSSEGSALSVVVLQEGVGVQQVRVGPGGARRFFLQPPTPNRISEYEEEEGGGGGGGGSGLIMGCAKK